MCRGGALSFCSWGHNLLRPQGQASTDTWILKKKPLFYCHILNRRPEDVVQLVKYLLNIKNSLGLQKASMVTDTYNLSTGEVGAGGTEVQMYPPLCSEYELCLGHLRLRKTMERECRSAWRGQLIIFKKFMVWTLGCLRSCHISERTSSSKSAIILCSSLCGMSCLFCDTLLTCSDSVENTTTFKAVFFFNISFFMILVE